MQIIANNFLDKLAKPEASPIFIPKTMTDAKIPTCHKTLIISIFLLYIRFVMLYVDLLYHV